MRNLKRNWQVVCAAAALVLVGGLWWGLADRAAAMSDPQPRGDYGAVTPMQREAILRVLADVGLDHEALVALNVNLEQAEELLAAGRTWWEQYNGQLQSLRTTIGDREEAVRQIRAAIRMGPAQPGQDEALDTAVAELLTAKQAYRDALSPLRTALATELSETQRAVWAAAKRGLGGEMPVRVVNLSAEQRPAVARAQRIYRLTYAAARNADQREAARLALATALDRILTQAQKDAMQAYQGYWVASSEAVIEAMGAVLPLADA